MNRQLKCLDCEEPEFHATVEELEAHIACEHLDLCPYECEKCKFAKFPTEYALVSHCRDAHGMPDFTVKYRHTPELSRKKRELADRLRRCIATSGGIRTEVMEAVSTTEGNNIKIDTISLAGTISQPNSPGFFVDPLIYQAFEDPFLFRGLSAASPEVAPEESEPTKAKVQIQCQLCLDTVSKQRSSMVYHANTRHGRFELFECGYCNRKWQTIAKSDVVKHIKSHHEQPDGTVDLSMVIDYRKDLGNKLKEVTEQCFPNKQKQRIGYTDRSAK